MSDSFAKADVKVKRLTLSDILRENIIWVVLIFTILILSIASPVFLTPSNALNILRTVSILGIVAIGMTFPMIGGSFDLTVGATMGLATVIAIQSQPTDFWSALVAVFAALVAGLIVGIITIIAFVFAAILGTFALNSTRFGRYLDATGGNTEGARLSGIEVWRVRLIAFTCSGLAAAFAGIVIAARVKNVDPSFGVGFEFEALTAVILGGTSLFGGRGSVSGTVAGVLILGVLANAMTLLGISIHFQLMIKGVILVLAVAADVLVRRRRG